MFLLHDHARCIFISMISAMTLYNAFCKSSPNGCFSALNESFRMYAVCSIPFDCRQGHIRLQKSGMHFSLWSCVISSA